MKCKDCKYGCTVMCLDDRRPLKNRYENINLLLVVLAASAVAYVVVAAGVFL